MGLLSISAACARILVSPRFLTHRYFLELFEFNFVKNLDKKLLSYFCNTLIFASSVQIFPPFLCLCLSSVFFQCWISSLSIPKKAKHEYFDFSPATIKFLTYPFSYPFVDKMGRIPEQNENVCIYQARKKLMLITR